MIDTDKYKGHTKGSKSELHPSGWWVEWVEPCTWYIRDPEVHLVGSEANRLLIQDTPLLLDAYKQLREDNKKLHDAINRCAYRGREGSAHDLYCESIIERCPTCDENTENYCGCEEE